MASIKKAHNRMCVGCRQVQPKAEMIRIVRAPSGEISADITGKKPGRGAYICKKKECFDSALKTHAFNRAFCMAIDEDVFAGIRDELFPLNISDD